MQPYSDSRSILPPPRSPPRSDDQTNPPNSSTLTTHQTRRQQQHHHHTARSYSPLETHGNFQDTHIAPHCNPVILSLLSSPPQSIPIQSPIQPLLQILPISFKTQPNHVSPSGPQPLHVQSIFTHPSPKPPSPNPYPPLIRTKKNKAPTRTFFPFPHPCLQILSSSSTAPCPGVVRFRYRIVRLMIIQSHIHTLQSQLQDEEGEERRRYAPTAY